MRFTISGAGNRGRGIGTRVVAGAHEVDIGDRDADDAARKVAQLVAEGGLRPLDVGPLATRQLEQLGFLRIAVQQPLDGGFGGAIKLHS
jgi:predicted dinucleotide-binding enzyme